MYIIPQIPKIRNDLAAGSLGMREIPVGEQKPLDAKTETGPNDHPELTNIPPSLSSIQCLGAFKRFKCFFGPRTILLPDPVKHTHTATTTCRSLPEEEHFVEPRFVYTLLVPACSRLGWSYNCKTCCGSGGKQQSHRCT